MSTLFASGVFILDAAALFYTFAGYALHIGILARLKPRVASQHSFSDGDLPEITVVLVAHNEAGRIEGRVANLLASDYPAERLRVRLVSDGSTDDTVARVPAGPRVEVIARPTRTGKPSCLNAGVCAATSEIVVFADARQRFEPDTIRKLAVKFADPSVGAVSGALQIAPSGSNTGTAVDAYWQLEKWIRSSEAQFDSSIGCTGAVYAIRRALFQPIPADTILDDVIIPMQIALAGFRVLFEKSALAWDPQCLEPELEQSRKKRTLAGNFQMLFRYPGWLLPWKNRLWWQLLAHKYLRLAGPALLAVALISNGLLLSSGFCRVLFAAQCACYALAASSRFAPRSRLAAIPAGFVFLNVMTLRALWHYLFVKDPARWGAVTPKTEQRSDGL